MSFGLGLVTGIGQAIHESNTRQHQEDWETEKHANQNTLEMLKGFLANEAVDPDTKNAAMQSYQAFLQTKGMPTSKHRSAALEPVLARFNRSRPAPDQPAVDNAHAAGAGLSNLSGAPGFGAAGAAGGTLGAVPNRPSRSGFMQGDEIATDKGRAIGAQTKAVYNAMGLPIPGLSSSHSDSEDNPDYDITYVPDGKGGLTSKVIPKISHQAEADYTDEGGVVQRGMLNFDRAGNATDSNHRPVQSVQHIRARSGYVTMAGVDADNHPTKEIVNKDSAAGVPTRQYVAQRTRTITNSDNSKSFVGIDPATGLPNDNGTASAGVMQTNAQLANTENTAKTWALDNDPSQYPGELPAGQPQVTNAADGTAVTVGRKQFTAIKQPASVMQRASSARSVIVQAKRTVSMLQDPKNTRAVNDIFGKLNGRISHLLVEGPTFFNKEFIGPLGTSDPTLTTLTAAIHSVSDLLTTVHGRRAEDAAKSFRKTLDMVHSPEALVAALNEYGRIGEEISQEAERTTVPVTTGGIVHNTSGRVPTRPVTGATPGRKRITLDEALKLGTQ